MTQTDVKKRYLLPHRHSEIKLGYEMGRSLLRTTNSHETLENIRSLVYDIILSLGVVIDVTDSRKSKTAKEPVLPCHYNITSKTQVIEMRELDAERLRKLVKAFDKALVQNYNEGKKDGQSVLIGLNAGDISMKDFEHD